jgi:ElaB/YqjD/DUF883 family membrane-anchored ribosome-binding protein
MATTHDSTLNAGNRKTLGEQTSKVAEDVRELGNMAFAGAGEALDHARERGKNLLERGKDKAVQARDGFEDYVAEHPFKSVLIAAGIGALIGYSLRNRS